jgi:hypothetical protein
MLVVHKEGASRGEHAAAGSARYSQRIGHSARRGCVRERAGDGRVGAHRGVVVGEEQRGHLGDLAAV